MRLIDADKIIQKTYGVVIEDMFHMHETVEVVSTIDIEKAPTVKAIPIEWIKRKAFENPSLSRNLFYRLIIEEWEKENETTGKN